MRHSPTSFLPVGIRWLPSVMLALFLAACSGDSGPTGGTNQVPVATVAITPSTSTLSPGQTVALAAVTKDGSGKVVTGRSIDWSSSNAGVASVSSSGSVTAIAEGSTTITATSEGKSATATITVGPVPVATVVLTPSAPAVGVGATAMLSAETRAAGGTVLTGRTVTWTSSSPAIATVSANGEVTGVTPGATNITATSEGRSGSVTLTVFFPFSKITAGWGVSCALDGSGQAFCWGENNSGELGTGTTGAAQAVPRTVVGGHSFSQIQAGFSFVCGLDTAGAAWCWGDNASGQVGNGVAPTPGGQSAISTPAQVAGGHLFVELASGGDHACGRTAAGVAWCWGYNIFGQLGDGTTATSNVPVQVAGGQMFAALGLGSYHSCGVTTGGAAYCWGRGTAGQLGNGTTDDASAGPVAVSGGNVFASIGAGQLHSCAWTAGGKAYCWGGNNVGMLGDGTTIDRTTPTEVSGNLSFAQGSSFGYTSCGSVGPGTAYCWGDNFRGQVGDGSTTDRSAPTLVGGTLGLVTVAVGFQNACGLTGAGQAYCWGAGGGGELGNGNFADSSSPVLVLPPQ